MRIVEEQNPPAESAIIADNKQSRGHKYKDSDPEEQETEHRKYRKRRRSGHSCLNFFGCLSLMLIIVFAIISCLVIFVAGPIVTKVDDLPKDFPKKIAIYQIDQAKIKIQSPEGKEKALNLIGALPEWALNPFAGYLSTEIKTQIMATGADNLNFSGLEQALADNSQTVSLSWDDINKTKEDLADYYKTQLKSNGFEIKEDISDYEINLRFIKEGTTGAIAITDSFLKDNNSLMKFTINYLTGN